MRLVVDRVEVRATEPGALVVDPTVAPGSVTWSVANQGDRPMSVDGVAVVWRVLDHRPPLRFFRHGYQSWSPCGVATFGVDRDPSRTPGARSLVVAMHHADPAVARPDELRSELVTALRDDAGSVVVTGFVEGAEHDGTFRLREGVGGEVELWAEAYLGGAELGPGESRVLHPIWSADGEGDPSPLLEAWAAAAGVAARARAAAPYQVGWCSWYQYFWNVTEADLRANLARCPDWGFDVVQLDDGYQPAIGDWTATNADFPSDLDALAAAIRATGATPGLWLAPFLAGPGSALAAAHPDWFARHAPSGTPLAGMVNAGWAPYGATADGVVHVLDTTRPEVLDHLTEVAAALVAAGFPYLKLDFTYAPSLPGRYADPTRTPAQRVRAGFDAIRRGAGDNAFLLGCGAPLGAVIGAVDGMRIGPDVAPWWEPLAGADKPPGYEGAEPATVNAWRATLARAFLHRRLWLNDPDCLLLRTTDSALGAAAVEAWAWAVGLSGGMALVSDDLALLGTDARALFDDVVACGRAADDAARAPGGHPARCPDLLDRPTPTRLKSGARELVGDPDRALAVLHGPP